ncbi:MAG TPA: DinB family protein [Phycisphaerae bacterium]|nr:DinB family protein [Phycisphaerae bacterium]
MTGTVAPILRRYAIEKLADHFAQVRRCCALLSAEQIWFRPNDNSNSVANLLLHLAGNVRQWIVGGLGGAIVPRDRPAEFARRDGLSREQLLESLAGVLDEAYAVLGGVDDAALVREYAIQNYRLSGVAAILHVVEHFAFHTGQIVTTTKWLLDVDLSLYDEKGHRRDGRQEAVP